MVAIEPVDVEKVAAENPQSRFRVIDTAILPPGVCALCGSSGGDGRQFVDFGKTVDFFGCVYFCTWCVGEAATLLGLSSTAKLLEEISSLRNGCSERDLEIQELKEQLNAARVLLRNCNCGNGDSDDSVTSPVSMESEEPEANSEPVDDSNEPGGFKGLGELSIPPIGDDEPESPKRTRRKT